MMNFKNILISIDQLFNTLAGGNPDVTISSHCYQNAFYSNDIRWIKLRILIDKTFAPIESRHCYLSWIADNDKDETDNLFTTIIVAIIGCTLLFIPIRILGVFKNG